MSQENILRVNTMYGVDGRLRTSYFENEAAVAAARNVKAFRKELAKYEKDFAEYASLNIDETKLLSTNARFIFNKLDIADSYVEFVSDEDMADIIGDETVALVSNKNSYKLGIGAKLANKFRLFFEKQAEKHPHLQGLADRMTRVANGGRMPLTADSTSVMRIAFDKKFYNDCRKPGADMNALREQYNKAIKNLATMAMLDGVSEEELSNAFAKKLITQMQIDETLTDIYTGMASGNIRLADSEPLLNAKNEEVCVNGKTLYNQSAQFVSWEKDENGVNKLLDAWQFKPREPQSIEDIIQDYQTKFQSYALSCNDIKEFEKMLCSNSYKNLERNAKVFAEADCPDDAAKFKHEFARCNLICYKNWAIEHGMADVYEKLRIPASYDEYVKGNVFAENYSTNNYDMEHNSVYKTAVERQKIDLSKDELAEDAAIRYKSMSEELCDKDAYLERLNDALNADALAESIMNHTQSQHNDLNKPVLTLNKTGIDLKQKPAIEIECVASDKAKVKKAVSENSNVALKSQELKSIVSEHEKIEQPTVTNKKTTGLHKRIISNAELQSYDDTKSEISKCEKSIINVEKNVAKGIELKSNYDRVYNKIANSVRKEVKENGVIRKDEIRYYLVDKDTDLKFVRRDDDDAQFHDGAVNVKTNSVIRVDTKGHVFLPPDYERGKLCDNESNLNFNILGSRELNNLTPISKKQYERILDGAIKKDSAFKIITEKVIEFNKNREIFCQKLNALHEQVKPFESKLFEAAKNISFKNVSRYDLPCNAPVAALPNAEPNYALG